MSANRSTAVMQRRRVAPDGLDYFPTPPFATRALCEFLESEGQVLAGLSCWEPACGELHMVRPLAESFIATGLKVARCGVAMLVRSAFLEGRARHESLFSRTPPTFVLQFVERIVMLEGRLVRAGSVDPFAEVEGRKASTATSYVWLVWMHDRSADTRLRWIAPCRRRLESPADYPVYAERLAA